VVEDGTRINRAQGQTPVADGPAAILRACVAALTEARDGAPVEIRTAIVGVGISSPGPVDPWRGMVLQTPNMGPGFNDVPIAASVGGALGLPAFLDRDANVAALARWRSGRPEIAPTSST